MSNPFFLHFVLERERGRVIVWNLLCLKPNKFQNFFYPKEIWVVVPNAPYQMWTCLFFFKKRRNIECCFLFLFVIPIELATLEISLQPNILLTSTWMFCWWAGGCGDMWEWSFTTPYPTSRNNGFSSHWIFENKGLKASYNSFQHIKWLSPSLVSLITCFHKLIASLISTKFLSTPNSIIIIFYKEKNNYFFKNHLGINQEYGAHVLWSLAPPLITFPIENFVLPSIISRPPKKSWDWGNNREGPDENV